MELFFLLQKDNSRRYKYIYIYICFVVKLSVSIEYSEKKESKRSLFRERTSLLTCTLPLWISKKVQSYRNAIPFNSPWIQLRTLIITANSKYVYIFILTSKDKGTVSILDSLRNSSRLILASPSKKRNNDNSFHYYNRGERVNIRVYIYYGL